MKILKMFLQEKNFFGKKYSLDDFKRVRRDVESIFLLYTEGKRKGITLEKFSDFCQYFFMKAKEKKILRYTKRSSYTFSSFLEEAIEKSTKEGFKEYMLFLKKNQKILTSNDIIRIFKEFNIIDLPKEVLLNLLETDSKIWNNLSLGAKSNLKKVQNIFQENYDQAYLSYQQLKNNEDLKISKSYIFFYISEALGRVKFLDQGHDLLKSEEEQRAIVYLDVFLFDYMRIDQDYWKKNQSEVSLDFKQIRNFLKFLCLSVESLEILESKVIFTIFLTLLI